VKILHLYRPRIPSVRAQSVQVVHTCHALAARGHQVTLLCDPAGMGVPNQVGRNPRALPRPRATAALAAYGLDHPDTFDLRIAPTTYLPLASLWFRAQVAAWQGDVVYARAKRYVARVRHDIPVVIEAHEVDSEQAREAGEDADEPFALEEKVFARASGVVANCGGTLRLLEQTHPNLPRRVVIQNATRADRAVTRDPSPTTLVGYTGSPKPYKGLDTVFASMPKWPGGVELEMVGGAPPDAPPQVVAVPPVPYGDLPARLARYHALLLPLDDNLFGRALTSPLKLWDYLATGIPIVAADLPTVREIAGDLPHYYTPGDPDALADALVRALAAGEAPRLLRTWDDRAAEIERFLRDVLG
jgi:glycosyltransferase involved in cell wall biosynthesis